MLCPDESAEGVRRKDSMRETNRSTPWPDAGRRKSERGVALVIVMLGATIVLLLLLTMLTMTTMSGHVLARQLTYSGQALNAASAGLNEGLSWFVHQKQQPVTTFAPQLDPGGVCPHTPKHVPPVNETDDPATGLVRTYEVSPTGRVWARYTLSKTNVKDVSRRRGKAQDGTVWRLDSEGVVFVRNDAAKPPEQSPNFILARSRMRTEIERLGLSLPANAALNAIRADNVHIVKGRVQGGSSGIGVAYPPKTNSIKNSGTVSGNPPQSTTNASFQLKDVFGVTQQELIAMADIVADSEKDLPDPLPAMALIVIKGNATFNPQQKLNGSGVLVVLGDLNLNPQSDPFFNGVIWVGKNLNISPPASINGSIIAMGNATLSGGNEISEIDYDGAILDQIRLQMGNYLASRSPWIVGGQNK